MSNIILIGFMGCGKSSVGEYFKAKGYGLIDTDTYIEKKMKMTVSEIFSENGEEYFRQAETDTIKELIVKGIDHYVIAVGGGLTVREENRELLHKLGKVVYLTATVDTLESRLKGDTKRPLLKQGQLRERIQALMEARQDIYVSAADYMVSTDDKNFEKIAQEIQNRIYEENTGN